ncbi:MAG: hypothetical protein HXX13_07950 [Bacteroidetes bacterium]|nr:hypothetical protein [Bacteroidota bacterium]
MTPDQFRHLTSLQQMELLFDQGRELMCRIFVFYNIRLYTIGDFFVEVWYRQTTNKIDRIIIMGIDSVLELYENQIKLSDLF